MNAFATIVEVVEVAALIVLVIYLIRLIRDRDDSEPRSVIIDRNLAEIATFNRIVVGNPDIARIWQDGREDRRLNDIDQERFSLLATDYLSILANQRQRAVGIADEGLVESATLKLIDALQLNPGLLPEWEEISHEVASPDLREAVNKAMNPVEDSAIEEATDTPKQTSENPAPPSSTKPAVTAAEADVAAAAAEEPETRQQNQAAATQNTRQTGSAATTSTTATQTALPQESVAGDSASESRKAHQTDSGKDDKERGMDAVPAKAS